MTEPAFKLGGGLEGLAIGSSKESVRAFFGANHQPILRMPDKNPADCWPVRGVFAYYDDANLLEAVEFSNASQPTLNGKCLTTMALGSAIELLRAYDPELRVEPGSATSTTLGISIWSSTVELDQPVMSVITFGPGYYG